MLSRGGLVALPTETVYGLGASALDPQAVARVFEVKRRPRFDPLIVHLASIDWLDRYAQRVSDTARRLADEYWPGPLTIVLEKVAAIPEIVTSGLETVGLRVPESRITREIIELAEVPVAAPSANLFGRVSPTRVEHVLDQLGDSIDLVVDGGPCRIGVESTVVKVDGDDVELLRYGGVPIETLENFLNRKVPAAPAEARPLEQARSAPGMLPQHYAPETRVLLADELPARPQRERAALIAFGSSADTEGFRRVEQLSSSGDLVEAAAHFFAALRKLDQPDTEAIYALRFPDRGLGRALNDRLERASAK